MLIILLCCLIIMPFINNDRKCQRKFLKSGLENFEISCNFIICFIENVIQAFRPYVDYK